MGILDSLFGKKNYFESYTTVARTRVIRGVSFPSFIKKEDQYIFTDFEIFEDGIFYCNDFVDQPLLKERLEEQWLNYQVPEGERFVINDLGSIRIQDAEWNFKDHKGFFKLAKKYLKELNPSLKNLYDFFGENTQEINGVKVPVFKKNSFSIYEEEVSQINSKQIQGRSTNVFYQEKGKTFLADLAIFEDGTVKISRVPEVMVGNIAEIERMFEEGALKTLLDNEERVLILGLGEFSATEVEMVSPAVKIQEIKKIFEDLKV
ncbi:hypothetical protein UJ101_02503 [Flavobacteriaceae bacterium UJ101]|nr:hypothetical protein UJ101_02503 [Flavobacteriaceae bacterium UJ101]